MIRMKTAGDVRRALQRVANQVLEGKVAPQTANAFCYLANGILASLRVDEQDKMLDELQRRLEQIEEGQR